MSAAESTSSTSSADALRTRYAMLRDEFRLKLHLLGMDARDRFREIERDAAKLGHKLEQASHATLTPIVERLETLLSG